MTENRNVFDVFDNSDTSEEYIDSDNDPEYEPNSKKTRVDLDLASSSDSKIESSARKSKD